MAEETKTELTTDILSKVSGGTDDSLKLLSSIEAIESSPIFEQLKEKISERKSGGLILDRDEKIVSVASDVRRVAKVNRYTIHVSLAMRFVEKWWPLV